MKPPETVTLIDLQGKPICQYVEGKTEIYYVEPHKSVYDGCLVIEHYPDVFSKLTPWKGESTDV